MQWFIFQRTKCLLLRHRRIFVLLLNNIGTVLNSGIQKFHQTIAKGKLREVMIWPLETAANYSIQEINSRKKYWIRTLLKPKIWVRKQTNTSSRPNSFSPAIVPTRSQLTPLSKNLRNKNCNGGQFRTFSVVK